MRAQVHAIRTNINTRPTHSTEASNTKYNNRGNHLAKSIIMFANIAQLQTMWSLAGLCTQHCV